jgi:hypothetical protein
MNTKLSEIDFLQVYSKWNKGLDSFKCFFRATNFVTLKHYPDFELNKVPEEGGEYFDIISNQLKKYSPQDTLFLIDITGNEAIRIAYFVRKMFSLAPILAFNGVLHPFGLIGDKNYISNLIGYGMLIEDMDKKGHLLVLDHDRFDDYSDEELKENFNNQYELGEEDLPSVEMLDLLGYNKVVYMYEQDEKEDMVCYLEHLSENNIYVEKVELVNHIR